ncbi:MAG TPA: ATP-binding protein [Thermoanaerobaculia bacterium]|nr:ATP-binding protein [Thermoanaerobaculia bacterium]
MKQPIRILMLEDSPADAELTERELRRAGVSYLHERVDDASSYRERLLSFEPDIILSDYNLPGFDGLSALRIRNEIKSETPFIFVSGTLGEERAVEAVLEGATDYVLKNRLTRLVPALERAILEFEERGERRRAEKALEHQASFQELIASLSTRFVNLSDSELDKELQHALEKIGRFVHADRAFLFLCSGDGEAAGNSIEWCAPGVDSLPSDRSGFPCSASPWLLSRLRNGELVRIKDIDQLPPEAQAERDSLTAEQVNSFLSVPMMVAGALIGFAGFSPLREEMSGESDSVALLQIAGEIFGSAIARRKSEEALQHEKDFVSRIVDTTASLIVVLDASGCFVRVNPAFENTIGYTLDELKNRHIWDVGLPANEEKARQALSIALREPLKEHHDSLLTREGDERKIVWQATPIRAGDHHFVVGTGTDVTERSRIEEERARFKSQLEQTTRLDGLGRLAATITHEFNNVLMGIKPFTRVLEKRWPEDPGIAEVSNQIAKSVLRGERITREILRFTRPAEAALVELDLKKWLAAFVKDTAGLMTDRVDLQIELPDEPVMIDADPTPLHQALSNLVLNARDAMPEGGSIRITLRHDASVGFDTEDERSFVQLTVSDDGRGIPAEILPHIFEPLFTTKKSGTGLGLAVTYQIITAHRGYIFAESEMGQGTSFHLFFPVHGREARNVPAFGTSAMRTDMSAN